MTPHAKQGIVLSVLSVLLLGGGFALMNRTDVTCGSDAMVPGDQCIELEDGERRTLSYEEVKAGQDRQGWLVLGGGALMGAFAGWTFSRSGKRRREEEASVASAGAFMDGPAA